MATATETSETNETTTATEKSPVELLAADLTKDGATFDGDAQGLWSSIAAIGEQFGEQVRSGLAAERELYGIIAARVCRVLRFGIVLDEDTGRADVGGSTATYKRASALVVQALAGDSDQDRSSVRNRLNKRVQRMLASESIAFVLDRDKVRLSKADLARLADLSPKDAAKLADDDKLVPVVAAVNALYGAGTRRPSNVPRSPFERPANKAPNGNGNGNGSDGNEEALTNAATIANIVTATASGNVSPLDTVRELFRSVFVLRSRQSRETVPPTDAEEYANLLEDLSYLAFGMRADLLEVAIDDDDVRGYGQAIDSAEVLFGNNDDADDDDGNDDDDDK